MEMTYNGGPPDKGPGRYVKPVAIALVLAGVAALIWHFAGDTAGVKRVSAPQVTTVIPLPPPPAAAAETEAAAREDQGRGQDAGRAADDRAEAVRGAEAVGQPAEADDDECRCAGRHRQLRHRRGRRLGDAGQRRGGKFGNASYAQYMVYVLQRAIEQDKGVQEAGGARFAGSLNLWMDTSGRITKVTIAQSTGDAKIDAAVVAAVEALGRVDEVPPPATSYPVLVKLQGRKPA